MTLSRLKQSTIDKCKVLTRSYDAVENRWRSAEKEEDKFNHEIDRLAIRSRNEKDLAVRREIQIEQRDNRKNRDAWRRQ